MKLEGVFKNLLLTAVIAASVAACGVGGIGGGGSSAPATTSTVATTQAVISSSNATKVATASTTNLSTAQSISEAYSLKPYFKPGAAPVYDDGFGKPLADAIAALDAPKATGSSTGSCGGSYTYTTSTASASFVFTNYCSGSTTMNGTITATGTSANATITIDLTMTTSSATATMTGTVTATKTTASHTIGLNLTFKATSGSTTYYVKLENYNMTLTISGSTYSETVTGRFYYDQTGYVDLTTPTPLTGSYSTGSIGSPTGGELRMTGGGTPSTIVRAVYAGTGKAAYSYSLDGGTTWIAI